MDLSSVFVFLIGHIIDLSRIDDPKYVIGQILGLCAVVLGIISFQMKDAKRLMILQVAVSTVFCVHYLLIGQLDGCVMNIVTFVRNFVYIFKNDSKNRILSSRAVPIFFTVVMIAVGIFAWSKQNTWYSVFLVVGLAINSYCMSFKSADNIRRSILVTSPMMVAYNVLAQSPGGAIYESMATVSAAVGLIRSARSAKKERKAKQATLAEQDGSAEQGIDG